MYFYGNVFYSLRMKKFIFIVLVSCFIGVAYSQVQYNSFSLDIGVGAAIPTGIDLKPGVVVSVEPRYALLDKFILGARLETTSVTPATFTPVNLNSSALLTFDYYITNSFTRPFVGGGLGAYYLTDGTITRGGIEQYNPVAINFGQMLRLGVDFNKLFGIPHVKISGEYNFSNKNGLNMCHNYIGAKISMYLWGAKL